MNSQIYKLYKFTDYNSSKIIDTLVISYQKDKRSLKVITDLINGNSNIKYIIILNYQLRITRERIQAEIGISNEIEILEVINVSQDQAIFVNDLKKLKNYLKVEKLCLDISCMNIPQMFLLLKYLKCNRKDLGVLQVFYTFPFDYIFPGDPFTSYKSYLGDIETAEILGYSGNSEKTREANLAVFIGFEGALSSKIIEDIKYKELFLINGLPSFFPKYKDITVINNYEIICQPSKKMYYVPANNPYEVYNFLESISVESEGICIAPLSTKPIALGVCLFSLNHPEDVRIVYPISQDCEHEKTLDIYDIVVYELTL